MFSRTVEYKMVRLKSGRELIITFGLWLLPIVDRIMMRFAATEEYQVFPNEVFAWTTDLAENWTAIRDEAQELMRDPMAVPALRDVSVDHEKIAVDGRWRSFFLWGYGIRSDVNCARCPETARALERIPGLLTAMYSVMLPGAHVPRHTGPTKAIVTAHLGLMVPRDRQKCRMAIGDHEVVWQEGQISIFDDMFPHEVWNNTEDHRVILLLHVKRPLRFPGSLVRDALFALLRASPFVRDGVRNIEQWHETQTAATD
ncbi:aspartyl/asparaginyl beta-hydroxylase domain-containing protein [Mycobacterium lentiflavum]|uniref:Aspartyl/asparaginyl beta-hydroxylase domain-containing protein n=1 Tax=Mycobacterium lentiflavum TaxID=141349 RepID=A0ABY3URZ3_MYCLN|nr:aspartyl/asparaginyl beta-hydroxylase domain-containing protein [Mycobacterium lentiflavum]ULP41206.1 aspartyl/asparaginyl beta-hydroxylase domain-containing protein [Mycobacterium lentiflavum]